MSKNPLYRYTLKCNSIAYNELLGVGVNSGLVRMSLTDGYALLWDTGQDFTRFQLPSAASNKGARRYQVYIYDDTRVITGYLDITSTGEALGSNVIAYNEFSDTSIDAYGAQALTGWTRTNSQQYFTDLSAETNGGCFAAILGAGYDAAIWQTVFVLPGHLYELTVSAEKMTSSPSALYISVNGVDVLSIPSSALLWPESGPIHRLTTFSTIFQTDATTTPVMRLHSGTESNGLYVDWVRLRPLTNVVSARGCQIYDAPAGGSRNICGGYATLPSGWRFNRTDYQYKIIPLF